MKRTINGFEVEATSYPDGLDGDFYQPALRVTKPGTNFDEISVAATQNLEKQSRAEAATAAETWLQGIEHVSYNGTLDIE